MTVPAKHRVIHPFRALRSDLDELFSDLYGPYNEENGNFIPAMWKPSTDISETEKEFIVRVDLPGMKKEDIEVSVVDGLLNIRGERSESKREENEDLIRVERSVGSFLRRIPLSESVKPDAVKAAYNDGELVVRIPKMKDKSPKKIKVD